MVSFRRLFRSPAAARVLERRATRRVRTRLRPGKLLGGDRAFLADCAILERSSGGLRVRVFGEGRDVGEPVVVFDEKEAALRQGRVAWVRGSQTGIRLDDELAVPADARALRRLAGPYYAVGD